MGQFTQIFFHLGFSFALSDPAHTHSPTAGHEVFHQKTLLTCRFI